MKIAAVVFNSVSHDARVLKEAESLAKNGHEVTLIGICDNRNQRQHEPVMPGFEIRRAVWRPLMGRMFLLLSLALSFFLLCSYVCFWIVFFNLSADSQNALYQTAFYFLAVFCPFIALLSFAQAGIRFVRKSQSEGFVQEPAGPLRSILDFIRTQIHKNLALKAMEDSVYRELEKIRPEAVHCHDLTTLPVGARWKQRHGGKLVYDSHEVFEKTAGLTPLRGLIYERLQRKLSRYADGFITVNESIAEYLNQKYERLPKAIVVMNAARFAGKLPEYDGRLHSAAKVSRETSILLYQGGFSKHRGLEKLIRSGVMLPENWVLVMMGWGALQDSLTAAAKQVDPTGKKIRFLPGVPQKELPRWTQGAALGIIPYENVCMNHWLCTPNKIWEYTSAQVPLLVSPFPELKKVIDSHGVGWLLDEPLSEKNIAAVIAGITESGLAEKRENCLKFAEVDNWSVYEKRLLSIYEGFLGK